MRQFYRLASGVLAWLGQGYGNMDRSQYRQCQDLRELSDKLVAKTLAAGVRPGTRQEVPTIHLREATNYRYTSPSQASPNIEATTLDS